ncbi:hypothetical protein F5B22DRAFT_635306 [Xylaria bambusicola]|uniref:uncharacterized protein n=1 Tax=Xylaria bambusicola TaxID=326684 RepID=UPI002007D9CA|nr:uncharacterized protein F5B22DRAFT_635306 [Xylaria bambusicola]KAI0518203.1 hypothetical protein F5B22DRAFT_635306 [Xylaria bambusicola]
MSHKPSFRRQGFEILCDSPAPDSQPLRGHQEREPAPASQLDPLCHLSISQSQNRQLGTHELNPVSYNSQWGITRKNSNKDKRTGGRLIRPSITPSTFEVLNAVAKPGSQIQTVPAASTAPDDTHRILQLPVDRYSSHPLSIAARSIPRLEQQLAKHRDGLFEWVLAVNLPSDYESQRDKRSVVNDSQVHKAYFGCNLLPESTLGENKTLSTNRYLLLVTPVVETNDVLDIFRSPIDDSNMALPEVRPAHSTPIKASEHGSVPETDKITPNSTSCTRGDNSRAESIVSLSPGEPVTRIEDSFEALDILEDQLEAFDEVARFNQFIPTEQPITNRKSAIKTELTVPVPSVRFATPQAQHTYPRPSSASLRVRPATEPRRGALRKAISMNLDSHRLKVEEKTPGRHSPNFSAVRGSTNSSGQSLAANSTKRYTNTTSELAGEAAAQQLKERREARLVSQRATQPTASSLRRAKSAKLPTRPVFELPGEAISRRKREEHQAHLKTREDEEKRRREFKARPVPSRAVPAAVPRETVTSRVRQNKAALPENSDHVRMPNKRPLTALDHHSRTALSSTINQPQSRGRELRAEGRSIQDSRATSTSTGSTSEKRSLLSTEDMQMQKLRGHEIYQRDNSWTGIRMREKCERETLAKFAREEAAERSRRKSREWAAKQARKRMTASSSRDVMA